MGFNSTLVVMNDALDSIKDDKELGEKIYHAVMKLSLQQSTDINCGGHVNAITAIESHHASRVVSVLVGGNYGKAIDSVFISDRWENMEQMKFELLKELANNMGYRVSKKPQKKKA